MKAVFLCDVSIGHNNWCLMLQNVDEGEGETVTSAFWYFPKLFTANCDIAQKTVYTIGTYLLSWIWFCEWLIPVEESIECESRNKRCACKVKSMYVILSFPGHRSVCLRDYIWDNYNITQNNKTRRKTSEITWGPNWRFCHILCLKIEW